MDNFGKLLNESWMKKIKWSKEITNKKINEYNDEEIIGGALGGRFRGGGEGGFFL